MTDARAYADRLAAEAEFWGRESERQAAATPPDWRHRRGLRQNLAVHGPEVEALLAAVRPGMRALELGCASGCLTLAMAERGAHATGLDISAKALDVARAYYESVSARVTGTVGYRVADLNHVALPVAAYDLVAVRGTLHHLVRPDHAIREAHRALRPGGLLWIADTRGEEALATVLVAGALTFLLPTTTAYGDKLRALRRFGPRAPSRVRASMQAEGLSPFEGAGRGSDWLEVVRRHFAIERQVACPAFTGYVAAQLDVPERIARPLIRRLRAIDRLLVRLGALRSSEVVVWARKAGGPDQARADEPAPKP